MTALPPAESRGMTIVDLMALTFGMAGALAIARSSDGLWAGLPPTTPLGIRISLGITGVWAASASVAIVALVRSIRFDRPGLPGEWLAVLLAAIGIAALNARSFAVAEQILIQLEHWPVDGARRLIASGWTLLTLGLIGTRVALRRRLAPGCLALLDVAALVAALVGPIAWLAREGPSLMDPSDIFNLNQGWTRYPFTGWPYFRHQLLERVSQTPIGLPLGFASVAFLREGWRRARPWTAWAGAAIAWPVMAYYLFEHPSMYPRWRPFWLGDVAFHAAWTAGEWAFAWFVLRRLQPAPAGVEPGPVIGAPASTSAT